MMSDLLNKDSGDITKVFRSEIVRDLVVDVSQKFGVAENMVYPVQNYSAGIEKELGIDILNLRALRQILRCSEIALDDMLEREEEEENQNKKKEKIRQKKKKKRDEERVEEARKTLKDLGVDHKTAHSPKLRKFKKAPTPPASFCRARFPRSRDDDDELDMERGDRFEVITPDVEEGWTLVKNNSGETGKVPTAFCSFE